MPYIVKKVPNKDCWTVINVETGRVHAKCTTLAKARIQYNILNAYDNPCKKLRKSPCEDDKKCLWTVGKGCDKLVKSPRLPQPWEDDEKAISPVRRYDDILAFRLKTPSPVRRRKSPVRDWAPRRSKSPIKRKSPRCSRLIKKDCVASPNCKWIVGKGCHKSP